MRPFCLDHEAFDNYMVDLTIVISSLSFALEIDIRASRDCMDCDMCREIVALM
jgi:hypothetical protein